MGRSSGLVGASAHGELKPGEFRHQGSGATYRIYRENTGYYLEFTKEDSLDPNRKVAGRRRLEYFIGSGAAARAYVHSQDGFLFQAPVSYYSSAQRWDLPPGYQEYRYIHLSRPVDNDCLECHASGVRPIPGTTNRYEPVPFLEGAIGCERCHGPGQQHVAAMSAKRGRGAREIINPAKLDARRRDSVCALCHLSGEARVPRAGRSLATFKPGDLLTDHVVSFVWEPADSPEVTVISHFERLWRSRCKEESGDRMWCGTCHDPHSVPAPSERAQFFRQKCLGCHQDASCRLSPESRAKQANHCAGCHMPTTRAADGGHSAFTDHFIRRPDRATTATGQAARSLAPFWGGTAHARERGLAYADVAQTTQAPAHYARAFDLLKGAAATQTSDDMALMRLAFLYSRRQEHRLAMELYERSLKLDPSSVTAAVNLATYLARQGRMPEAIRLWQDTLTREAGLEAPGINLARAYLQMGDPTAARNILMKLQEHNPDSAAVREALAAASVPATQK